MAEMTNLRKALTSTDAAALIPYDLEPYLDEELIRLQPLASLLPFVQAGGKTHEYQVRTSHPQGWFEGETTPANVKAGTFQRKSVQLKISRIWGSVAGFTRAVTGEMIDSLATEIEGSVQGMADLLEYGALFGCSTDTGVFTGDGYQYTGIIPSLLANAPGNVIDGANTKVTLDVLDESIEKIANWRQTRFDPRMFFMSMRMKQVVDGLQSKVQLPLQTVSLADGKITMAAYGDAPILETDYMKPGTSSPAVTSALAAGGALPDATAFTHQISSVTIYGECIAGTAGTQRTTGTGNFTINLTWTADAAAKSYIIWRKTASGEFQLLDIIPALTYDSAGTVNGAVASYSDAGAKSEIAVKPLLTGQQQILLINRHPNRGAAYLGRIDDMGRQIDTLHQYVELARVKDTYDYMIKAYLAMRIKYPNLFSLIRHIKLTT